MATMTSPMCPGLIAAVTRPTLPTICWSPTSGLLIHRRERDPRDRRSRARASGGRAARRARDGRRGGAAGERLVAEGEGGGNHDDADQDRQDEGDRAPLAADEGPAHEFGIVLVLRPGA